MGNGDDAMTFKFSFHSEYQLTRNEVLSMVNNYLKTREQGSAKPVELIEKRNEILKLYHYELLIAQSEIDMWEKLMTDTDLGFRRSLCAKLYNIARGEVGNELGLSSGQASNLFNRNTFPNWPRPFQLSVLFDHPWQLVNYVNPDIFSFSQSPEFYEEVVADRIEVRHLMDQKVKVKNIRGYVITNPREIFNHESDHVTGRWVTSWPEFDYFQFHLNSEPLIDNKIRKKILQIFPLAKYVLTTYRPFKPDKRSLWVIIPKMTGGSYQGMLHELIVFREKTEFHSLT